MTTVPPSAQYSQIMRVAASGLPGVAAPSREARTREIRSRFQERLNDGKSVREALREREADGEAPRDSTGLLDSPVAAATAFEAHALGQPASHASGPANDNLSTHLDLLRAAEAYHEAGNRLAPPPHPTMEVMGEHLLPSGRRMDLPA